MSIQSVLDVLHVTMCLPPPQRDFIVQTGDPTGTGRGGESVYRSVISMPTELFILLFYWTPELNRFSLLFVVSKLYGDQASFFDVEKAPRIKHKKRGTISMVNNGNNQHGSQVTSMLFSLQLPKDSRLDTTGNEKLIKNNLCIMNIMNILI